MADESAFLKFLVQIGVTGKEDLQAAKDLFQDLNNTGLKSEDSLTVYARNLDKTGEAAEQSGGHVEGASNKHKVLHKIIEQLNEVSPGLGSNLNLLAKGYMASAEAAETGAAANRSFLVSMGPLAIAFLSIQAAVQYWKMYEEASQQALEKEYEANKKNQEGLRETIALQKELNAVRFGTEDPLGRINKEAAQADSIRKAQQKSDLENLKVREDGETAAATTPEDKDAVKKRYNELREGLQQAFDEADALALKDKLKKIDELKDRTVDETNNLIQEAARNPAQRDELNARIKKNNELIDRTREAQTTTRDEISTADSTNAIKSESIRKNTATRAQNDGSVEAGVDAIIASQHGPINAAQKQAIDNLKATFTTISGNTDNLIAAVKYGHDHALNQAQESALIKKQLQYLAQKRPIN